MELIIIVATLLGGVAAIWYFIDKWKARRYSALSQSSQQASFPHVSTNSPTHEDEHASSAELQKPSIVHTTSVFPDSQTSTELALPIDVVIDTIEDENITSFQKAQFTRRHSGRRVIWTVQLMNIQPSSNRDQNSDLIMVIAPPTSKKMFPQIVTAVFPASEGDTLVGLDRGDIIVIEGILSFYDSAGYWSSSLKGAHFIRRVTQGRR